jgi:hypothetical protein
MKAKNVSLQLKPNESSIMMYMFSLQPDLGFRVSCKIKHTKNPRIKSLLGVVAAKTICGIDTIINADRIEIFLL